MERTFTASGRIGSWTAPNGDVTRRFYDLTGNVREEVDPLGNRVIYAYDGANRLQSISDLTLGVSTTFARDSAGRVVDSTDALNHTTHTAYRLGGRLDSTTNARGFSTSFTRSPLQSAVTDALTRTTTTTMTGYGLPVATTYPGAGSPVSGSTYQGSTRLDGSQNFPTQFTDESARTRDFTYDSHSGLTATTDLEGNAWSYSYAPSQGSAITYDVFSGEVGLAHHRGGAQAYAGVAGGTEYRDVDAVASGQSDLSYLLDSVTSPLGETTLFERGTDGRIARVTYPDGNQRQISYSLNGEPSLVSLPQGTLMSYQYDSALRETARTTDLGESRAFTYGPMDRIETMTDPTGTTTYHYDASGRFTGLTYPHGGAVTYARDVLGRATEVRVLPALGASELVSQYTYDANGNLETVTDPQGGVTQYVYDAVDRLVTRTLPNGVTTTYTYDDRDRVLSIEHKSLMGQVLQSTTYVRAATGEPLAITREDGSYALLTYDAALRLSSEAYYDSADSLLDAINYEYDSDGNRTGKNSLSGGYEAYAYQPGFQLGTVTRGGSTDTFGYDGGGRVTRIDRDGVLRTLEYNSDDKVTRIVDSGVETARYAYDGVGRRVEVVEGGSTRRYLVAPNEGDGYESPQVVTDAAGNVLEGYVFAGEHPIARFDGAGNVEYLLQDAMGTVTGVVDAGENLVASAQWDAFGELRAGSVGSAAVGGGFGLHGMWLDEATGVYYVRARGYDARTGRFLSRDPVEGRRQMPESYFPYGFANQNPMVFDDPTGEFNLTSLSFAGIGRGIQSTLATPSYAGLLAKAAVEATVFACTASVVASAVVDAMGPSARLPDGVCIAKRSRFVIQEGVRRAKAHEILGFQAVPAVIGGVGGVVALSLDVLYSPKPVIDASVPREAVRFAGVLEEVRKGEAEPIDVTPGETGTPIRSVQVVYSTGL